MINASKKEKKSIAIARRRCRRVDTQWPSDLFLAGRFFVYKRSNEIDRELLIGCWRKEGGAVLCDLRVDCARRNGNLGARLEYQVYKYETEILI